MAGKLCDGGTHANPHVTNSRAYCEGRAAAVAGALIGTNPHPAGSPDNAAWAAGHGSYAGGVGSPLAQDCCADIGYDGVP